MELLDGEPLDQRLARTAARLPHPARHRRAGRRCAGRGAQRRHPAPRHQAGEHLHHPPRPGEGARLRPRQALLRRSAPGPERRGAAKPAPEHFTSVVGTTVGTIAYMSPEQARGEDVDPRTDLFSFGVVLYEMATGRQSFPGHTTAVVFDGILNREPVPRAASTRSMPPELDRLSSRRRSRKIADLRYQTAADLGADLQRLRRDSGTRLVVAAAQSSSMEPASAQTVMLTASGIASAQPASAAGVSQPHVAPPPPSVVGGFSAPAIPVAPHSTAGAAPASSKSSWVFAGMAVGIALIAVGAGIWVTMRPQAPVAAALPDPTPATEPPSSAPTPTPTPDPATTPPPASTPLAPAGTAVAAPASAPPIASAATAKPTATSVPPPTKAAREDAATSAGATGATRSLGEGCGSDPAPGHREGQAGQQPGGSGGCRPAADHVGLPGHGLRRGRGVPGW